VRRLILILIMLANPVCLAWMPSLARGQQPEPTVEGIIAKWEERQKKVVSARFRWNEEQTQTKGYVSKLLGPRLAGDRTGMVPPEGATAVLPMSLSFDHQMMRYELRRKEWRYGSWSEYGELFTFDGKSGKNLRTDPAKSHPVGQIRREDFHTEISNYYIRAILMTFRPTYPNMAPYRDASFKLTGRRATINGRLCHELLAIPSLDWARSFWVDPSRDWVVLRFMDTSQAGIERWKLDVEYREDADAVFVPKSWSLISRHSDGSLLLSVRSTVTLAEINPKLALPEFDIDFPPGTFVFDDKSGGYFIQKQNGETRPVTPNEFTRPYHELVSEPAPSRYARLWSWPVIVGATFFMASGLVLLAIRARGKYKG